MGKAARFVKYNSVLGSLRIKEGMTSEDDLGDYIILVKSVAESGLSSLNAFVLTIVDPGSLFSVMTDEDLDQESESKRARLGYIKPDVDEIPEPQISLIDNIGETTIFFSQDMVPIQNLTELKNATVVMEDYSIRPAIEV